jgi:hypothetical protein
LRSIEKIIMVTPLVVTSAKDGADPVSTGSWPNRRACAVPDPGR